MVTLRAYFAGQSRRHWLILILASLVVRGALYFSYPLPVAGRDDNQAAQVFLMDELASGEFLIGNVRYNTGYPLVMWPFRALTRLLGVNHDRFFLLVQLTAYSAIPLLVYDMMRRRFNPLTALITALTVLLDPFGLQWAHLYLPVWLIALLTVFALWAAERAWSASRLRRLALAAALWRRDWLLATVGLLLLACLLAIALAAHIEPRLYGSLWPMYAILIGWFLAEIAQRAGGRLQ